MNPLTGTIGEAWEFYKAHWRHFVPIAFVVYLLLALFTLLLVLVLSWLGAIAAVFVSLAGIFWLQGALVTAIEDVRDGKADLSIGETLAHIRPRLNTLALAGILAALGITLGFILLIVPGFILLTIWSLIVPVIVLEGSGTMDSFGRSRELTRGNRWGVFGRIIVTVLIVGIAGGIVSAITRAILPEQIDEYVANVISSSITAPYAALVWTLMYYRLRAAREPGPPAEAAA
ncbi:MAG: YciC family protein [Gaiellaceae bacterium]